MILVNGKRVGRDVDMPEDIGAIIEAPGFLPNYSGYKNLRFLANIRRKIGKEEILNVLKTVGLDPESRKHVGKYSARHAAAPRYCAGNHGRPGDPHFGRADERTG